MAASTIIIVASVVFIITVLVILDQDLRVLKQKQYHDAIASSHFMRGGR